jgi:hypothetical protein
VQQCFRAERRVEPEFLRRVGTSVDGATPK